MNELDQDIQEAGEHCTDRSRLAELDVRYTHLLISFQT